MIEYPELNSVERCPACGADGRVTDVCLECQHVRWKFAKEYVELALQPQIKRTCPTCNFYWYEKTFSEIA